MVEQQILGPGLVLEPAVAPLRLDQRRGVHPMHAREGGLPELCLLAPQPELRLDQPAGIGAQPGAELEEHAPDASRVRHRIAGLARRRGLIAPELLHDVLAALGELGQSFGQEDLLRFARLAHGSPRSAATGDRRCRRRNRRSSKNRPPLHSRPGGAERYVRRPNMGRRGVAFGPKTPTMHAERMQGGRMPAPRISRWM